MNKSLQSIAIVAGGTLRVSELGPIQRSSYVIGVDRGAYWLVKHHVQPDLAIGDFDSVTPGERKFIETHAGRVVVYPAKKDATDLELAVDETIRLHPKEVTTYGAIGTRFDHTYAATGLLLRLESHNILGQIVDNYNKAYVVRHQITVTKDSKYRYVSVFPVSDHVIVTLKGFVYDASRLRLVPGSTLGVSNEIRRQKASILVHKGALLVVESRDRRAR